MTIKTESFPESSIIDTVSYDSEKNILSVKFTKGRLYAYLDVPRNVWIALVNSDSIGKTFTQTIKGKYSYERIS